MTVQIDRTDRHVQVRCPLNNSWKQSARDLRGRWLPDLKCWSFLASDEPRVKAALVATFGKQCIQEEPQGQEQSKSLAERLVAMRAKLLDPSTPMTQELADELISMLDAAAGMLQ